MRYICILLLCLSWSSSQKVDKEEKQRLTDLFGTPGNDEDLDLTPGKKNGQKTESRAGEISQAEKDRLIAIYGYPNNTSPTPGTGPTPNTLSRDDTGQKTESRAGEISQAEKDRLIAIYGYPNNTSPTPGTGPTPNTLSRDNTENQTECELTSGKPGVCVLHYLCNPDTETVINDGATIIDIRQRECPHYLQVCCSLGQTTDKPPPPPVVEQAACGWSNPGAQAFRVRNDGGEAEFGDFPWMVAILKRSEGTTAWSQSDYMGGGSIIHPSVVLTGAHKVDGKQASEVKCRAGEWDTQTDKEIYPHQERNVKKIVQHAQYYRPSVYNSVALLILDSPFEFKNAPHMGVGCVGPHTPPAGARCFSMGWGKEFNEKDKYAVVLKKVEVPWVPRDKCQKELRKTRLGSHFVLHPSLVCAGGEPGKDTCQGDGGSPLVCPIGDTDPKAESARYAIFGMVAWGIGCGDAVPGVYVNVPYFYEWLGERMREEGFGTECYTY